MSLEGLLGLPFAVWAGLLSLALAAVFTRLWPRQAVGAAGWRYFLIRWGHAGVWLLLAVSFFLRAAGLSGLADPAAAAAGLTYLAFLAATFTRRAPPAN